MKIANDQIIDKISWFGNKVFSCDYIIDNSERMTFRYDASAGRNFNFDMSGLSFYVSIYNRTITIGYNETMPICFISAHENGGIFISQNESIKDISTYYYLLLIFAISPMDNMWFEILNDNNALKARFIK